MPRLRTFLAPIALAASLMASAQVSPPSRLLVLTDIEADPDDTQSLVRLLLYANEIEIEGLVATTSTHLRTRVAPESIHAVLQAYAKVHPNLLKHDRRYADPRRLASLVKRARPEYGMAGVGAGKDSEGSDWIIRTLEKPDPRPLWISVWGGANTLAQALHTLRATRPAAELDRLVAKLRVYTISDQDDAGPWIRKNFPNLFYIVSPGGDYSASTWQGINVVVNGIDNTRIGNKWIAENIQQKRGPLGAAYPDVAWGVEGDTPSWLNLIPNGLSVPEHPEWGGWGGRYELYRPDIPVTNPRTFIGGVAIEAETRPVWSNAIDEYSQPVHPEYNRATRPGDKPFRDFKCTLWRWRDDFQNDFAARLLWSVRPYAEANHPPVPALDHSETLTVRSGETITMSARKSSDPDGDSLSFFWFPYPEAGSYRGLVRINGAENATSATATAPKVTKPETLHFLLSLTDKGSPALTRYKRVVVTVTP